METKYVWKAGKTAKVIKNFILEQIGSKLLPMLAIKDLFQHDIK